MLRYAERDIHNRIEWTSICPVYDEQRGSLPVRCFMLSWNRYTINCVVYYFNSEWPPESNLNLIKPVNMVVGLVKR